MGTIHPHLARKLFKSDVQTKITVDINHLAAKVQHALPVPLQLLDQMYQLCHTHIAVIICLQDMRIPAFIRILWSALCLHVTAATPDAATVIC